MIDCAGLGSAFAAIATLSACGGREGPADIRTGDIPAPADRVKVFAAGPNGFAPFSRWPKACDLFTEADVRAAYPGISKLEQDSIDYKLDISDGAFGRSGRETVVDGTCAYECKVPGVAFGVTAGIHLLGGIRFDKQPDNQNSSEYVRSELLPAYAAVVANRLT